MVLGDLQTVLNTPGRPYWNVSPMVFPIGHCDASLTPNVVREAVASLPDIADKGTLELINNLLALMPIGYVQHLTEIDANNQRLFVNTEPVANLVDATWLSLPASASGRSSFPLYIVSVSSEPSLAKTLVQSLGRNLNFSTRGAKVRLRLAGLLVIQNDTPLLVEHFDGQFGHVYHPNRGGIRLLRNHASPTFHCGRYALQR